LLTKTIGKQASSLSFDIGSLAAGIYNVTLTGEGRLVRKQIVKQ
jgi:hypothetical protein